MALRVLLTAAFGSLFITAEGSAQVRKAHPVIQNIGSICRWQKPCMARQRYSMQSALAFVVASRPATWRVHLCNRNASRARNMVDWIGFDSCIRNKKLKRPKRR